MSALGGVTPRDDERGIEVRHAAGIDHVTIRRPPVNALGARAYAALREAFSDPAEPRVRVLRGSGRVFCSGQDLDEAAGLRPEEVRSYLTAAGSAVAAVARSQVPLVAVVNGPAVGTGALLVALADFVVMSEQAWLSFPELHLGLPLGRSVLSRFLPARLARGLLATGERITADRLAMLGAADHVVPADRLDDVTTKLVGRLLDLPPTMSDWLFSTAERAARTDAYLDELGGSVEDSRWPDRSD